MKSYKALTIVGFVDQVHTLSLCHILNMEANPFIEVPKAQFL